MLPLQAPFHMTDAGQSCALTSIVKVMRILLQSVLHYLWEEIVFPQANCCHWADEG